LLNGEHVPENEEIVCYFGLLRGFTSCEHCYAKQVCKIYKLKEKP
jgi:hypothetical protein